MFYVCRNCQKSAGEVLAPAYDDYVETLPAQGYDSSGGLLWSPQYAGVNVRGYNGPNRYCSHISTETCPMMVLLIPAVVMEMDIFKYPEWI